MDVPVRLRNALGRLGSAIDQLEAAAARRQQGDAARANLEEELAVMQDDRARLAMELDSALARGRSLAAATGEVARRLERIEGGVKAMIETAVPDAPEPV